MLTAGLIYNNFEQNLQNGKWINDNLKSYFLLLMTLTSRTILVIRFAEFQPYIFKILNLFQILMDVSSFFLMRILERVHTTGFSYM